MSAAGTRAPGVELDPPDPSALVRAARTVVADGHRLSAWTFFLTASRRLRFGARDGHLAGPHSPASIAESASGRYLLVWDDDKVSRGTLDRSQLEGRAADALRAARRASIDDPDAAHVRGPDGFPDVELWHEATAELASGENPATAGAVLTELAAVARDCDVATWSGSVGASAAASCVTTSAGLEVDGRGTSYGWGATFAGLASAGFASRSPQEDDRAERLDRLARTYAALRRPGAAPPPGVRPIVIHPDVVESFFLAVLFHNLAGATVDHGDGAFAAADFGSGRALLREDVTVRVDPERPMRLGSYRFSSEGVPARATTFVDRGRLVVPVLDTKYARRLGREPTGLPSAWDAVHVEGPTPLGEEDAASRSYATVLSVLGGHTQDFGSGDFSLSAPQMLRHGPTGPDGRIRGTIAGNVFDLLRSSDLELVRFEGETTPGMLVRCRLDAERV